MSSPCNASTSHMTACPVRLSSAISRLLVNQPESVHVDRSVWLATLWRETWDTFLYDESHHCTNDINHIANDHIECPPAPLRPRHHQVWERHCENKAIEKRVGLNAYRRAIHMRHQMGDEYDDLVRRCMLEFDACADICWDGPTCPIRVGHLRITPFPFEATLHFEDSNDVAVFSLQGSNGAPDLLRLIEINTTNRQIVLFRRHRALLRSLAGNGTSMRPFLAALSTLATTRFGSAAIKSGIIAPLGAICSHERLNAINTSITELRRETYRRYQVRQESLPYDFHVHIYHHVGIDAGVLFEYFERRRKHSTLLDMIKQSTIIIDLIDAVHCLTSCSSRSFLFWAFVDDLYRSNLHAWRSRGLNRLEHAFSPIRRDSIAFMGDHIRSAQQFLDALAVLVHDDGVINAIRDLPLQPLFKLLNRLE